MAGLDPQSLEGENLSDRIRLVRLRAIGWLGYVYQGEVVSMGRPVASCAVKLLHARPMCSPETLLQDMREQARFVHPHLLSLQHSGIVRDGVARDWIFLASELAEHSIQDLLTRGTVLTPTQVRECLVHALEALRYLHGQGIVHGEIRPANLLATNSGWRLGGLEYRGTLGRRCEELGFSQNHFVFRAPEAQEKNADHSSADMWSLAVVAHAALTGRLPFDEEEARDRSDLQWRIVNQEPQPEALGQPFDSLMFNCLVRDPQQRWNADQALACMQGKSVEDNPVRVQLSGYEPAPPPPAPEVPVVASPPSAPNSSPLYVALGCSLVLVGLFIGKFLLPPPPRRITQVLATQLVTIPYEVGLLDSRGRLTTQPAQAPMLREDLGEGIQLELAQIPAGDFEQGSPPGEIQREADESPRRVVRVDTFYMSRYEITQQQWALACTWPKVERALPPTPARVIGPELPVSGVSWDDAREFCLRLTQQTGRLHRLPTEAEWEYACRGGPIDTPFHFGPVLTDEVANFAPEPTYTQSMPPSQDRGQPVPVQTFPYASHFGLFQMHGNVKEWCLDFYAPYPEGPASNPRGPDVGRDRVVRGGGYRSPAGRCRSAARFHEAESERPIDVGFRVVVPEVTNSNETF